MKRYVRDLLGIVLSAAIAACGPAAPPPAGPVAVDNGQPKMQATLQALGAAEHELEVAAHNKAGHRVAALGLVRQASAEVQAGIQYAAAHPTEVGPAEGPAAPEPVDDAVAGGAGQPHMAQALVDLREARKQLRQAKGDKGGHRARARGLIDDAIKEVRQGIGAGAH